MGYTISNFKDDGYFYMIKDKNSNYDMEYLLDKHNINLDDYLIVKKSNKFRLLSINEINRYSGIICYKKDMYKKEDIEEWIYFLYYTYAKDRTTIIDGNGLGLNRFMKYLMRPFPPIAIMNKIRLIEWDIK